MLGQMVKTLALIEPTPDFVEKEMPTTPQADKIFNK